MLYCLGLDSQRKFNADDSEMPEKLIDTHGTELFADLGRFGAWVAVLAVAGVFTSIFVHGMVVDHHVPAWQWIAQSCCWVCFTSVLSFRFRPSNPVRYSALFVPEYKKSWILRERQYWHKD